MTTVEMHSFPADKLGSLLEGTCERVSGLRTEALNSAYATHALHLSAVTLAHVRWGVERNEDALRTDLALAAEAGVVAIEAGRNPDATIRHTLAPDGPREVMALGDPSFVVAEVWIDSLMCAMLIRNRGLIERLTADTGRPPDGPDGESPRYRLLLAQILREFVATGRANDADILEMIEATDPETLPEEVIDDALGRASPDGQLLNLIGLGDAEAFGQALANAQYAHRSHYQLREHQTDWRGLLALDQAALAAAASDRGLAFEVASDYLPAGLIEA